MKHHSQETFFTARTITNLLIDLHCILSCLQYYFSGELKVHVLGSSPRVLSYLWAPIICLVPLAEVRETTLVEQLLPRTQEGGEGIGHSLGPVGRYLSPLQQLTSFLQCNA